jgi:hypothetical protein
MQQDQNTQRQEDNFWGEYHEPTTIRTITIAVMIPTASTK